MKISKIVLSTLLLLAVCRDAMPFVASTNFLSPDDAVVRYWHTPSFRQGKYWNDRHEKTLRLRAGLRAETGSRRSGRNVDGRRRSIVSLYNDSESIIKMARNPVGKAKTQGIQNLFQSTPFLTGPFTDDGTRGHVVMNGSFSQTQITLFAEYVLFDDNKLGVFDVGFYLPAITQKVHGISFKDKTKNIFGSDQRVREFIKDLRNNMKRFGDLDLSECSDSGLGDAVLMLEWHREMPAINQSILHRALLYAGAGVLIPSGSNKNEDQLFSIPTGTDGTFGFPIKVGGVVEGKKWLAAGFDVDFLPLLDKTKVRRLKTERSQTDMFLLNKGNSRKNYGFRWSLHGWVQGKPFDDVKDNNSYLRGIFVQLAYQFSKQHEDRLFAKDNRFRDDVINTAKNLRGWDVHNVVLHGGYDLSHVFQTTPFSPVASVFYKFPVAGKSVIDTDTLGVQLRVGF